jgi:hypothetical protein
MGVLIVPPLEDEPWPSLGGQVCDFIEERAIFGPGSLKGDRARLDDEKRAAIWRAYEVFPKGHPLAGRRRFKRVGLSWRKGTAKTEWAAWLAYAELHPEGPVRCDGFDARGNPVGRPVRDPYIPMLAYTQEQTEELAYAVLFVVVSEGPDADLFDAGLDRIIRLDDRGRPDGKATALSGSPNARDGARTTFQHFDEPHRMTLPKLKAAHETMVANLPKRPLEDPWGLYTTTAGEPGQESIAEHLHAEAEKIRAGEVDDPELFYFHREAGPGHDLATVDGRIRAIHEATGPVGEYGPGQFRDIARQWERHGADLAYLERVWLNRWVASGRQAFDVKRWHELTQRPKEIPQGVTAHVLEPGRLVVAGFDGARFRDATGIVVTDVLTGRQFMWAVWERPEDVEEWEIPEAEVTAAWEDLLYRHQVWKVYGDPPHWTESFGSWAGRWPDIFEEWWTNRPRAMAQALRAYRESMDSGAVLNDGNPDFARHVANAGRKNINLVDDDGQPMWLLSKIHPDKKFDLAMAAVLSWRAYLDAVKAGVKPKRAVAPRRIR